MSLTTLFVVGPEEYVEFNESMGSKAFVEHIWDQARAPLKPEETSAAGTQLHSAGARISPTPPPKIEFPTILRIKGRGSRYQPTGKYISWEELRRRNPMAVKEPPSLDAFVKSGAQVGTAERMEPGAFLKGEKRFKIGRRAKGTSDMLESQDGWLGSGDGTGGGASESVYAQEDSTPTHLDAPKADPLYSSTDTATDTIPTATTSKGLHLDVPPAPAPIVHSLRKSRSGMSLSARLGMERAAEPVPTADLSDTPKQDQPPPQRQQKPPSLDLTSLPASLPPSQPALPSATLRTPVAQTPLSASHPPPETPLKHTSHRDRAEIAATPRTEQFVAQHDAATQPDKQGGLMLDPGVDAASVASAPTKAAPLPRPTAASLNDGPSLTPARAARSQIDVMLAKLRQTRTTFGSGGGSGESMWATSTPTPKEGSKEGGKSTAPGTDRKEADTADGHGKTDEASKSDKSRIAKGDRVKSASTAGPPTEPKAPPTQPKAIGKSLLDRLGPKLPEKNVESNEVKVKGESKPAAKDVESTKGPATSSVASLNMSIAKADVSSAEASGPVQTSTPVAREPPKVELERSSQLEQADNDKSLPEQDPIESSDTSEDTVGDTTETAECAAQPSRASPADTSTAEQSHYDDDGASQADSQQADAEVGEHSASDADLWSQIGNDTMSSVNWADDDDDESLPELPEEWMKDLNLSPLSAAAAVPARSVGGSSVTSNEHRDRDGTGVVGRRGAKRGGKGRAGKQEDEERGSARASAGSVPTGPRGTRSTAQSGNAVGKGTSSSVVEGGLKLAAVPPWQRRGEAVGKATAPANGPLGMRIAGRAEAAKKSAPMTTKTEQRKGPSSNNARPPPPPRELFPTSNKATAAPRRFGSGAVMPPNGTPLISPSAGATQQGGQASTAAKPHGRPRVAASGGDGAFARLAKSAIGLDGSGAAGRGGGGERKGGAKGAEGDATAAGRAKGRGGGGGHGRR